MKVKNIDTLFHGTKKLAHLLSIIKNGFYASYADEKFAGRNIKILMVSFSNIPLIEARNQVNYGDYFIGLKRSWGIEKMLHPVAYSYESSAYENNINYIQQEAIIAARVMHLRKINNKIIPLESEADYFQNIAELSIQELSPTTISTLANLFENLHSKVNSMQLYFKNYLTIDKKGNQRFAYNDREWRFIPKIDDGYPVIFESSFSGDYMNPEYINYNNLQKPHLKKNPLEFDLNDISYIIVKQKKDVSKALNVLNKKYTAQRVQENITSGELTIIPFEKIMNDL